MSISLMAMSLEGDDTIEFQACRSEETAWMLIRVDGAHCEIRMERAHVEILRDQLPTVLEGMRRAAAEDAACERAETAGRRVAATAVRALAKARKAEQAGAHDAAACLREAVTAATETANTVDRSLEAMDVATADADLAAERLVYFMWQADDALRGDGPPMVVTAG